MGGRCQHRRRDRASPSSSECSQYPWSALNPASLIESAAMLPAWLEGRGRGAQFAAAAQAIMAALDATIAVPERRTRDLGGPLGTEAFAAQVVAGL